MGNTVNLNLPYPELSDPPDGPAQIQALAVAIDNAYAAGVIAGNPVGTIIIYGSSDIPTNYLNPDGSAISRTTYADLFAKYGTTYGVGDGSTTFNLPDMRGRGPMGFKAADSNFGTLGGTGGAATVVIGSANLPTHVHAVDHDHPPTTSGTESATHVHSVDGGSVNSIMIKDNSSTYWATTDGGVGQKITGSAVTSGTESATHDHSVDVAAFSGNSGNGGFANTALATLDPFITLHFLVKVA